MTEAPPAPRRIGIRIVAVILAAGSINALAQVVNYFPRWGDDPLLLSLQQLIAGSVALVAAVGAWRGRSWSWIATIVYGLLTGILIISLGPLLELDTNARPGLWASGGLVVAFCAVLAWYLHRATRERTEPAAH